MARVVTYLTFPGTTEAAFNFYKTVFGTEFAAPIMRMEEQPPGPDQPPLSEADKKLIVNVQLPILAGHVLMGTDASESMGFHLTMGDNFSLSLEPDSKAEGEKLFAALSEGGKVITPMQAMPWGADYGQVCDKYGVQWMLNILH